MAEESLLNKGPASPPALTGSCSKTNASVAQSAASPKPPGPARGETQNLGYLLTATPQISDGESQILDIYIASPIPAARPVQTSFITGQGDRAVAAGDRATLH